MPRIVISDPKKGKAHQIEAEDDQFQQIIGKEIGEKITGDLLGLPGFQIEITGGSDSEGFPMRKDVHGEGRTRPLLAKGSGYNPRKLGERRRKTVRGRRVSNQIIQLNTKIVEYGAEEIEKLLSEEEIEE